MKIIVAPKNADDDIYLSLTLFNDTDEIIDEYYNTSYTEDSIFDIPIDDLNYVQDCSELKYNKSITIFNEIVESEQDQQEPDTNADRFYCSLRLQCLNNQISLTELIRQTKFIHSILPLLYHHDYGHIKDEFMSTLFPVTIEISNAIEKNLWDLVLKVFDTFWQSVTCGNNKFDEKIYSLALELHSKNPIIRYIILSSIKEICKVHIESSIAETDAPCAKLTVMEENVEFIGYVGWAIHSLKKALINRKNKVTEVNDMIQFLDGLSLLESNIPNEDKGNL